MVWKGDFGLFMVFGFGEFDGSDALGRTGESRFQFGNAVRVNRAGMTATGGADIKRLLGGSGGSRLRIDGEENMVHRLALGGLGSDAIAVREVAIASRQRAAIIQVNAAVLDGLHIDQLAVDELRARERLGISPQEEAVASSHGNILGLEDLKARRVLFGVDDDGLAVVPPHRQKSIQMPRDGHMFIAGKELRLASENQH